MLTVRDIRPEDRELYSQMSYDFYCGDAVLYPVTQEKLDATLKMAVEKSPYLRLVMLEDEGVCVGYANMSFTWSTEAGGMVMWIEEIYIMPDMRGRGYGKTFLRWTEQEYAERVKRFRLEVCPANPEAKRLYESCGFHDMAYIPMVRE